MINVLIDIGVVLLGVWFWQFLKIIDSPADPKAEKDFWQNCFFTSYWHGPDDPI